MDKTKNKQSIIIIKIFTLTTNGIYLNLILIFC